MNWNPYKRIAALEAMHVKNIAVLDMLTTKLNSLHNVKDAHSKWLASLQDRLHDINNQLNPYAAAPVRSEGEPVFTKAEVLDAAEQKRIRQREYQRVYYAKQRTKAKQREYAAAYRARKRAEKLSAGGTA